MNPMQFKEGKLPKVLVTGANGFIGRALCQKLVRNSIIHFRLFRPNYKKNDSKEQIPSNIVFGDLLDLPSLRAACKNIDVIISNVAVSIAKFINSREWADACSAITILFYIIIYIY